MQTFQIEVNDNMTDKFLALLENFKDSISVKKVQEKPNRSDLAQSIEDLNSGNITPIDNIESYIKELKNDIK